MASRREIRRVRRAQRKCGCVSLENYFLLASQTKSAPRGFDFNAEVKKVHRLETEGHTAIPDYKFPKFIIAFTDEVLGKQKDFAPFLKSVWAATSSSGRRIAYV
ncbi:MAG: hypothetical protein Q8O94_04445 [bacterium]|nr:hypothetical protein [bacterium]